MEVDPEPSKACARRELELSPQKQRPTKMPREDLVLLAEQISTAENFVQANACNKLQPIIEQINFLKQQAMQVLDDAQRDSRLHRIPCTFKKVPGQMYHLYRKPSGEQYFSLLSPEEWGLNPPDQNHEGSYRLEADHSWTAASDLIEKEKQLALMQQLLQSKGAFALMGSQTMITK